MHSGQTEEGRGKLRNALGYVRKLASCCVSWHRRKNGQSQTRCNQVAPLTSVKNNKSRTASHRGQKPEALRFGIAVYRRTYGQHHGQGTGKQKRRHDGGIHDAFGMEWRRPVCDRNAPVTVGIKQCSKGQRVGKQKQPHADFLRVRPEQRWLVSLRQIMWQCGFSHVLAPVSAQTPEDTECKSTAGS